MRRGPALDFAYAGRLTANLAIVTQPRSPSPRLKRLQLVFLQECVALLVIVLGETRLLKRLLPLADPVSQHSASALPPTGAHWPQGDGRRLSLELMREAEQPGLPEHRVEGLGRLRNQPEFTAGERARRLVQAVFGQCVAPYGGALAAS